MDKKKTKLAHRKPGDSDSRPPAIDDVTFHKRLGRGGFGEAWLADDAGGRRCVIKVLFAHAAEIELNAYRTYKNLCEANADGLVPIGHMLKTRDGRHWYPSEPAEDLNPNNQDPMLYEPCTLDAYIARSVKLSTDESLAVAESILRALQRLHRRGMVHCDIKPSNILRVGGQWRVGDTGTLIRVDQLPSRACSPVYAPEGGILEQRDDLYSVGKTLYEALTGSIDSYPAPVYFDDMPPEMGDRKKLRELNQVILRACHTDRASRYQSADAMLGDLQAIRAGKATRGSRKRKRLMLSAAVIGLSAVGAAAGYFVVRGWLEESRPSTGNELQSPAPIKIASFDVYHSRKIDDHLYEPPSSLLLNPAIVRENDAVEIVAEFDGPGYCYLLALKPDGGWELWFPTDDSPTATSALALPTEHAAWYLTDGPGLQAFILLVSAIPLSPDAWAGQLSKLGWEQRDADSVWRFDGIRPRRVGEQRGSGPSPGLPQPFAELFESVRQIPGVDAFDVIAFRVMPADVTSAPDDG